MFQNRYTSFNPHHTYIRRCHGKINKISLQLSNERNVSEDTPIEDEPEENNNELDEPELNEDDELNDYQ